MTHVCVVNVVIIAHLVEPLPHLVQLVEVVDVGLAGRAADANVVRLQ